MKKAAVLLAAILTLLAGCAADATEQPVTETPSEFRPATQAPAQYRVEIIGEYAPEEELKSSYFPGDEVTIVLGNITGHYYTVTVNGEECLPDRAASDGSYEVYRFFMPEEDVTVLIKGQHVDIPTLPPETEPLILQPEPEDEDFVNVEKFIPDIVVELAYFGDGNFTGRQIYEFDQCWLRYGTVKKLMAVQEQLREKGMSLKIWDGFRPVSAQWKLWDACPDPTYVANPNKGFSSHSRGNTVDVTLVYADGTPLQMPTGFDDFSLLADRDYRDCDPKAAENAIVLEQLMEGAGFKPYAGEWWHFSDTQSYPVEKVFTPVMGSRYLAQCEEFISLRIKPDTSAEVITRIPADSEFWLVGWYGDFALIEYAELTGFVLAGYICPVQ